jgi:hypothetical protein
LNEAEVAASRGGRHLAMDLSSGASVEDNAWHEPGLDQKLRSLL